MSVILVASSILHLYEFAIVVKTSLDSIFVHVLVSQVKSDTVFVVQVTELYQFQDPYEVNQVGTGLFSTEELMQLERDETNNSDTKTKDICFFIKDKFYIIKIILY